MSIFSKIKAKLASMKRKCFELAAEYKNDYKTYQKWNYDNPKVKTKNAFEAKILRQAHILEKGMSLSLPKDEFGVKKALLLLDYIDEFKKNGYAIETSKPVLNSIGVINAYLNFHAARNFVPMSVQERFEQFKSYLDESRGIYGIDSISRDGLQKQIEGAFPDFFLSRHSVRQFSSRKIDMADVKKAVALAMRAPSACNRQSWKVYIYNEEKINRELGGLIAGNPGFENEVRNYLVVTGDVSAFYGVSERNQVYVDGGIFTMALVESLHYYGIASCILQNGEHKKKDIEFRKVCGNIPENEKIILFIAIGYYKEDTVTYATSHRKNLEDVLQIK